MRAFVFMHDLIAIAIRHVERRKHGTMCSIAFNSVSVRPFKTSKRSSGIRPRPIGFPNTGLTWTVDFHYSYGLSPDRCENINTPLSTL